MQGAQKLRSEAHYRCAATTKLQRNAADRLFTRPSQFQLPCLSHQFMAEAAVKLLVNLPESGLRINMPGRKQYVVGPKKDFSVPGIPGETLAFLYHAGSDTHTARLRLNQKQTELAYCFRLLDQEYGSHNLAVFLGDPASLPLRIIVLDEFSRDARDQCFKLFIPLVFPGIEHSMAMDNPAHVANLVGAEEVGNLIFGLSPKQAFNGLHGSD